MPVCRVDRHSGHPHRCVAFGDLRPVIGQADVPTVVSTDRRIIQNRIRIPDIVAIKFNPLNN